MINKRDHAQLICDIGEISGLFTDSTSLESFLQKIVEMIATHMQSDVCSIYMYSEDADELTLKATKGLNADYINNISLKLGEGLTGLALKEMRPICERNASKNKGFRYFPGLGEEKFESFLAVPIIRGSTLIGTMVIQNTKKDYFSEDDIKALRAITSQLANTIEMTRVILSLEEKQEIKKIVQQKTNFKMINGKVGSVGYAFAEGVVTNRQQEYLNYLQSSSLKEYSLSDFYKAIEKTEKQLETHQKQIEEKLADVASLIFTAQMLMLKDNVFIDAMVTLINNGINPPLAIKQVVDQYMRKFQKIDNPYIQEKAQDIQDIGLGLLQNLFEKKEVSGLSGKIVIAEELLPSDILKLSSQNVCGIIQLSGGVTGHVSILAQSLQLPLIIADEASLLSLKMPNKILMDAEQGNIYIDPDKDVIESFKDKEKTKAKLKDLHKSIKPETNTEDGTQIKLMANINLLGDLENARMYKAEGIGLYRTEFPFIVRNNFPSEEEQYVIYQKLVEGMPKCEITFRTLDIGGDKVLSYFEHHLKEKNPYLGMRSIRFSLKYIEIFSQQIRAILRAGAGANIRIMFPMISSLDEFIQAKQIVINCIKKLKDEGVACCSDPNIGVMIELPSVLQVIDDLAQASDFFSVGTNDFIQYMLGVDRTNEKVADLYLPHHPSILRAIQKVAEAAIKHKKDISICGDMAHQPQFLNYFIGIGIRTFSLNPNFIPSIQTAINEISVEKAQEEAHSLLGLSRLKDLEKKFQS